MKDKANDRGQDYEVDVLDKTKPSIEKDAKRKKKSEKARAKAWVKAKRKTRPP